MNEKDQLKVTKGDFVSEHKGKKLTDLYRVDEKILGSGKIYNRQSKNNRGFWYSVEVHKQNE